MRMQLRALAGLSLLFAMLGIVAGAAGGSGLTFHTPVTLPGSTDGSEPSLALSAGGKRYASWQAPGEFASSPDGVRFNNLGMPDPDAVGDVTNAVDAAGAVYNGQICGTPAILHTCIYRSRDGGLTWPQKTLAADVHPGASDRPWIDVYPHARIGGWNPDLTTVYLEYHTFSPEDLAYVTVSHDGGKTFSPPHLIETGTNATLSSGCNTIPSGVAADDTTGTVYALWLSGDDVVSNATTGCNYSQLGPFTKAWVSTSTDGGLTWEAHLAWHGSYDSSTKIGDNADKIFGTIAVDRAGQVHVLLPVRRRDNPNAFAADCQTNPNCQETPQPTNLLLASSPDRGVHWTKPFNVRPGGSSFFPWLAAGSAGRLVTDYYWTKTMQPNDPATEWWIAFSQVTNATAALRSNGAYYPTTPVVVSMTLDPEVAHHGGICSFGIFCSIVPNANRRLADSIAIAIDPNGGANAVWTNDANGTRHIQFACQNGGPGAIAGKVVNGCYRATG